MSRIVLTRQPSPPPTPSTNKSRVYINSGGTLASVDDAGNVTTYSAGVTPEQVQDIIGGILTDTASVDLVYDDAADQIRANVIPAGVDHNSLQNYVVNEHVNHASVSISAGTGLTGGGDITSTRTLSLANTAVTAGSYGSSSQVGTFTVDAQGRLTSASNVTITPAAIGAQPLDGDLTAVANLASTGLVTRTAANTMTTRSVAVGTGLSVTNGDGVSGNPTITLSNTTVTAASYGSATQVGTFTVNAQGQLTTAANTAIAIPASQVTDFSEAVDDRVAALVVAGSGITATYNDPANTLTIASTITQYTDEQAQDAVGTILTDSLSVDFTYNDAGNTITAAVLPAGVNHNALQNYVANQHVDHSTVSISAGTGLSGGGDITASRTLSLANTAVTVGSYGSSSQVASFTVNAQGQLTAASNVTITPASINAQPSSTELTGISGLTTTGLVTRTAAGTYTTRSITAGTGISVTNGTGVSGDPSIALTNTGVTSGTYGSISAVPVITVDAQGRLTSVTTVAVTPNQWQNVATGIRYQNDTGNDVIIEQIGTSGSAYLQFRSARGTIASPAFLQSGDRIGGWGGQAWNGTAFDANNDGELALIATENQTATARGTRWSWSTTANGTATQVERMSLGQDGNLSLLTNRIINVSNPVNPQDVATKSYVDNDGWTELINTATLTNNSNVTLTSITNLAFSVVSGRRYRIECQVRYQSAAGGTGLALTVGTSDAATGTIAGLANIPTAGDGTAAVFSGHVTSLGDIVVAPNTPVANIDHMATIEGVFVCTGSGTLVPQFRSEVNGTTITVQVGSNILVREWA